MHEQLKKGGGERGLGDEIRRRLQNSFDAEQSRDSTTDELLYAIKHIVGNLDEPWHANRFAYEAFKEGINELLSDYRQSIEAKPGTDDKFRTKYGPDAKPAMIGRILAHIALKALAKRADEEKLR